jgi:hypothetical protein
MLPILIEHRTKSVSSPNLPVPIVKSLAQRSGPAQIDITVGDVAGDVGRMAAFAREPPTRTSGAAWITLVVRTASEPSARQQSF